MQYGLIYLAIVPLRELPAHYSQQVSQLLFGESFLILETKGEWLKIQTSYDDYVGWIHELQCFLIKRVAFEELKKKPVQFTHEPVTVIRRNDSSTLLHIPAGSRITGLEDDKFKIGSIPFELMHSIHFRKTNLIKYALTFLNTPYLWGGRTHFGIDCSGFSQIVFMLNGIQLKRDAWQQAEQGTTVDLENALPGDLAFFDNPEGKITHVGILVNRAQIIHASGFVKLDNMENEGIYSIMHNKYVYKLKIIKRFF